MRRILVLILLLSASIAGQSRRVNPASAKTISDTVSADLSGQRSVQEMFDEANAYNKNKFAEFEQKKIAVSDALINQTQRERKQLAAKYAAVAGKRNDLNGDETYYLEMLNWIADNLDATRDTFVKYLSIDSPPQEKAQNARAILAVVYSRQKDFAAAEKTLAEYSKGSPVRLSQRGEIERAIARGLVAENNFAAAASHAVGAYLSYKAVAADPSSRDKILDDLIDGGLFLFKIYRQLGRREQADQTLEDMRKTGIELQSGSLWYYALDSQIKYQIETGRKAEGLDNYHIALAQVDKIFTSKTAQSEIQQKLKKRGKQYELLGEPAPELAAID